MELVQELVQNQFLYITVLSVFVLAILVFVFGFQKAKEPHFDKLTSEDRKQNKKRKIKEKKPAANGNVTTGQSKQDKSPNKDTKKSLPSKEADSQKPKEKKPEAPKKNETVTKPKTEEKKALKKSLNEKPADFDDGDWEKVPAKGDKKKKVESPVRKEKKIKKVEKESPVKESTPTDEPKQIEVVEEIKEIIEEPLPTIEDKKDKKKKAKKVEEPKDVAKPDPPSKSPDTPNNQQSGGVAFDELGDVWTEAKVQKKSKKKTRKDN